MKQIQKKQEQKQSRLSKMYLKNNNKASAIIEYTVLILLFIGAIVAMNNQVRRVFFGRWKESSDRFGHGQQYDPNKTLECRRYVAHDFETGEWGLELWYDQICYACCMNKNGPDSCGPNLNIGILGGTTLEEVRGYGKEFRRSCCARACETAECAEEE